MFFYLGKLLFSGFLQFKGNFFHGQNALTELLYYPVRKKTRKLADIPKVVA